MKSCLLVESHYNKWIPAKMISSFSKFIMQDFKTIYLTRGSHFLKGRISKLNVREE